MNIPLEYMIPLMFAAALSPSSIMAEVLILSTPLARINGLQFLIGALLGQSAISAVALLLGRISEESLAENNYFRAILYGVAALFFVYLTWHTWQSRPNAEQADATPGWLQHIDRLGQRQILGVGMLTSLGNIKNITITLSIAAIIAQSAASLLFEVVLLVVFTLATCVLIAIPYIMYVVAPAKTAALLGPIRQWLITYSTTILMTIFIVLFFLFLGQGFARLAVFGDL